MDPKTLYNLLDQELPDFQWWPGEHIHSTLKDWGTNYPVFSVDDDYIVLTDVDKTSTKIILLKDKKDSEVIEECRQQLGWWLLEQYNIKARYFAHIKKMIGLIKQSSVIKD